MNPNVLNSIVKVTIPPASLVAIASAIQTLQELLVVHLYDLTPEEKLALKKPGLQSEDFMAQTRYYMRVLPELVPVYIDGEAIGRAVDTIAALREHREPLANMVDLLDDTIAGLSDFAYGGCLTVYSAFRTAADAGQPSATKAVKDLSAGFASMGRRAKPDPGVDAPAAEGETPEGETPPPAFES